MFRYLIGIWFLCRYNLIIRIEIRTNRKFMNRFGFRLVLRTVYLKQTEKKESSLSPWENKQSHFFFASMNLLKTIHHHQSTITRFYRFATTQSLASSSLLSLSLQRPRISLVSTSNRSCFALSSVSRASFSGNREDGKKEEAEEGDELVYQKTLRLVECAMFAAVTGLVYFLSNSLAIEVRYPFRVLFS